MVTLHASFLHFLAEDILCPPTENEKEPLHQTVCLILIECVQSEASCKTYGCEYMSTFFNLAQRFYVEA